MSLEDEGREAVLAAARDERNLRVMLFAVLRNLETAAALMRLVLGDDPPPSLEEEEEVVVETMGATVTPLPREDDPDPGPDGSL